jgi:hypothetical protein
MRGKKSYNIRNVEAHLNTFALNTNTLEIPVNPIPNTFFLNRSMHFQNNTIQQQNLQHEYLQKQQNLQQYINSKFGVSKYASNLVSGKMYKKI